TLLHPGREGGAGPDLLQDAHRLVTQDPGSRGARVAVEERPGVRATDPACLDPQERAFRVEQRLGRGTDLHHVDAGHEGGLHRAATEPSSCCSAAIALFAVHLSRITRDSARVMASGERCMKILRPTEQPIAPTDIADSILPS